MADLTAVLQTHHQAVDDFVAAANAVPSAKWHEARAAGKWSPGQVVEHVALAYEVNRRWTPRLLQPPAPRSTIRSSAGCH